MIARTYIGLGKTSEYEDIS